MIFINRPLDDITMYTYDYSFLNFLRYISHSRQKNKHEKLVFFEKLETVSQLYVMES